jgi:hypothetical protein
MANDPPISWEDLLDFIMAEHVALRAFMLSISAEIGRSKSEPEIWARDFIAELHSRIDANEKSLPFASSLPVHELTRKKFDALGHDLLRTLRPLQE